MATLTHLNHQKINSTMILIYNQLTFALAIVALPNWVILIFILSTFHVEIFFDFYVKKKQITCFDSINNSSCWLNVQRNAILLLADVSHRICTFSPFGPRLLSCVNYSIRGYANIESLFGLSIYFGRLHAFLGPWKRFFFSFIFSVSHTQSNDARKIFECLLTVKKWINKKIVFAHTGLFDLTYRREFVRVSFRQLFK